MFSKLFTIAVLATAVVAQGTNKCNVGSLQCCKSVQSSKSAAAQQQAGVVGAALGAVEVLVGLQCNPITGLIGVGAGANCNANPVCCENNSFNGVIAIGCTPINVNL